MTDHEERAAFVCALTALTVASGRAVGVGDPDDGDIFLPPAELWGTPRLAGRPWMEVALRTNIATLRGSRNARSPNHLNARIRLHQGYWF